MCRVLVVDDHADSCDMLATFLRLSGNVVRTAADGLEALRICGDFSPEVIFVDMCMPGMDGLELCARLRGNAATQSASIYALTAYVFEGVSPNTPPRGFDACLLKPVDLNTLLRLAPRASTLS